ncbi:hypothetical protein AZE42_13971 [Rhizopogon vesiculosus]|uniref:Uncharacterized protein n=1 Tax=Rhizopogon vesiculosus TaxID=180088 RepID=A0A1J8PUY7_9AGAM|nr:hypothetical protein AZE42_13971 [Rhizopogon vesiculosus]
MIVIADNPPNSESASHYLNNAMPSVIP